MARNDYDAPEPLKRAVLEEFGIDLNTGPSAIGSAEGWRAMPTIPLPPLLPLSDGKDLTHGD